MPRSVTASFNRPIRTLDPLFYGLACVIAFGLAVGTMLTLGVVPVFYAMFFRVKRPVPIASDA